ncbi:LpqN/LpqT family lipoprotein [Mycobacterium deserti]|uniref:LpqN/LpqT family lipoprotein n=1 Tax=Mycobacterium deserti TaxID=2978347 RepID=A0ABT2MJP2_9MYCO|nr:LpqN/LpqT family lipoprotein [Mycobacterium deserti]MCT7661305.1 LpqN/LpqT family lipoprotein [Mycobacterium deserti]
MIEITRRLGVLVAGVAAGTAGILGFAGPTASAQPVFPQPPQPAPATVTQTVVVAPAATPQSLVQPNVAAATAAAPGLAASPGLAATPGAVANPGLNAAPVAAPVVPTIQPAASGTLFDYFKERNVTLEPQASKDFKALTIVLPMPRGWAHIPDPNVPDAFAVIADRVGGNGLYSSNAQVVVYKLIGEFDPKEAISHGFVDAQQLPAWRATVGSISEYGGMPSSVIEGTYRENSLTLNTSRRHVIATSGPDRYLVSLSVTTSVDQVVAAADATNAIITGFKVSAPGAAAPRPAAPPPAAPAPAARAAAPGLTQPVGLPG